jgi:hypothetical protein
MVRRFTSVPAVTKPIVQAKPLTRAKVGHLVAEAAVRYRNRLGQFARGTGNGIGAQLVFNFGKQVGEEVG